MSATTPYFNVVIHSLEKTLSPELHEPTDNYQVIPVKPDDRLVYYRHLDYNPKIGDKMVQCIVDFPKDLRDDNRGAHAARYFYQHNIIPNMGRDALFESFFSGQPKKINEIDLFFAANEGVFTLTNAALDPYRWLYHMSEGIHKAFDDRVCTSSVSVVNTEDHISFIHNVVPSVF